MGLSYTWLYIRPALLGRTPNGAFYRGGIIPNPTSILTIGHSNHSIEKLLDLLQANGVEALVDTRSQPYSKYTPHFNREALQAAVTGAGMKYVYLGRELGGRPEGADFYDAEGRVLYRKVAASELFRDGV